MLKRKLARNSTLAEETKVSICSSSIREPQLLQLDFAMESNQVTVQSTVIASPFFAAPIWKQFYDLECVLNQELSVLQPPIPITHTYNPVEYASEIHCEYLQHFLDGQKHILFVGMNPGPNGMGQTGVPFGNISAVRDIMQLSGNVEQPPVVHKKRPVTGMQCKVDEPSGVRLWGLLQRLAGGSINTFSRLCFVHNFCPLAFFDKHGKNITPSELKGEYKTHIRDICLNTLDQQIELLQPRLVIAIGDYVFTCMKRSKHASSVRVLKLPHPSPRAVNNQNWPEKAEHIIVKEWGLLPYIQNTVAEAVCAIGSDP